ncbi:carboxylesterase/lipase family protein [Agromyces soli]|uniref:Carboxylic ester hydrolase n=1 Tax=Agromyces soli TaxID=659012 RepID=A0ABY4AV05_9MICO|nr:carboxylesterase/lipase family protein [Agromyces soli]UOE27008.1 carboxylesterase/lipase family protein [Agromyces soli]
MTATDRLVARTTGGLLGGRTDGATTVWRGIRYAAPPSGAMRWRAPAPGAPWQGIADAGAFGPAAPQNPNPAVPLGPDIHVSEDCLFLNVRTPSNVGPGDGLPVMVWVHGGAYTFGSASQPLFDGRSLVEAGEVVLVTINYRLGGLGFAELGGFATAEDRVDGNLALRDVLLALEWVQENARAFGGDPERVTVFGESAGGGLVTTLLATPSAEGLFARAIAQSSPVSSVYELDRAREVGARLLRELGAADLAAARARSAQEVVDAAARVYAAVPAEEPGVIPFAPAVDGELVPEHPIAVLREGRGLRVPLLIGTNRDEATLFKYMKSPLMPITEPTITAMFRAMAAERPDAELPSRAQVLDAYEGVRHRALGLGIARDIGFRMPTVWAAEGHARIAPVHLYRFDRTTPMLELLGIGATHASELPYLWGELDGGRKDPTFLLGGRRRGREVSRRMQERWTAFAHGRSPDAAGAPDWSRYDAEGRATLVIDAEDRIVPDLDGELRRGWGDEVLAFR